mgnify:CR=1 FL=1
MIATNWLIGNVYVDEQYHHLLHTQLQTDTHSAIFLHVTIQ